jgi:hypothetical protein
MQRRDGQAAHPLAGALAEHVGRAAVGDRAPAHANRIARRCGGRGTNRAVSVQPRRRSRSLGFTRRPICRRDSFGHKAIVHAKSCFRVKGGASLEALGAIARDDERACRVTLLSLPQIAQSKSARAGSLDD